jgi:hypothetical protein
MRIDDSRGSFPTLATSRIARSWFGYPPLCENIVQCAGESSHLSLPRAPPAGAKLSGSEREAASIRWRKRQAMGSVLNARVASIRQFDGTKSVYESRQEGWRRGELGRARISDLLKGKSSVHVLAAQTVRNCLRLCTERAQMLRRRAAALKS